MTGDRDAVPLFHSIYPLSSILCPLSPVPYPLSPNMHFAEFELLHFS